MNRHPDIRRSDLRRTHRNRGFTLIELMIAMLLGLIVIAGVTSVFLAGQKSYRTNGALAEVEDGSRIAFELLARDIRQAGETGCDTSSGRITNVLKNS
ncbi:MAG TPA: prepilin-type N-terminal cleavage/methylation domain-containing protein, partial [Rhodanobacteraceae bacterium]|nr:prepilin-type N-terminal cleavage/methylation domain-containing protein [Rhodanobacteraceae bacterium]